MTARHVLGALVTALSLTALGCSSSSHHSSSSTTTARSTTSSSSSSTSSGSSSTTTGGSTSSSGGSGSTTTTGGRPTCTTSQLAASLGQPQGAAGHTFIPLVLTNHGSASCVIQGYPGVSLLDGGGAPIGTPATRAPGVAAPAVVLAPGAGTPATLGTQNAGISPAPCWAVSTSIKVYPPNQLASLTIAGAITVCGGEFTVTPVGSA
jgi:hypothetical protein